MSAIKRMAIFVFSIYGFMVFLILMFLLLPFFLVAFLLPRPADGNTVYRISYVWARLFFFFTGIRYEPVYKWKPDKVSSYIIVTNHISYMDIPMMILATRGLPVRILGKAEMSKIPVFGFIYNMGAVTVKRNSERDRRESIDKLKNFLDKKISILICPEGTFNMTRKPLKNFYDGAFRIASELGEPVLPIIFPDTYDRLSYHSVFSLTPGRCRAIFLPLVSPSASDADKIPELKGKVFQVMEEEIIRAGGSWMKND